LTEDAGRTAYDQASTREGLAFGDQRSCANEAFRLQHRAVEDARAHADKAVVRDRAAVEDRLVPYGHPSADG